MDFSARGSSHPSPLWFQEVAPLFLQAASPGIFLASAINKITPLPAAAVLFYFD